MPKEGKAGFVFLVLIAIDQLTKLYFLKYWNGLVTLNSGGAWSVGSGFDYYPYVVVLLLIALGFVIYRSKIIKSSFWPFVLIYAGAVSDLIDRFRLGGVVDFINLKIWPSFNLADLLIVVGSVWIFFKLFFTKDGISKA